jgi:sugar phosphate isomerase/epimerase
VLADEPLFLSAGSMVRYPFSEFVSAAAGAGYAGLSVNNRLWHLARSREGLTGTDMRARLDDAGLAVSEYEGAVDWLRAGPAEPDPREVPLAEILDRAALLGAARVMVTDDGRGLASLDEAAEDFATACDRAAEHGLAVAVEFLPWTAIPDVDTALQLVAAADRPNGGIVLDTWHYTHGSRRSELRPADARWISCVQLADGRTEVAYDDLLHEATFERRVPGEGELPLAEVVRHLDAVGVRCPVAVELYNEDLGQLAPDAVASMLASAARRVLRQA